MSTSDTQPPAPSPSEAADSSPTPPPTVAPIAAALSDDELVTLQATLATATEALLSEIATWLSDWWEQPILQLLTRNPARAIATASSFTQLKKQLKGLQKRSRALVDEAVIPVLAPTEVNPNGQFTEVINAPISHLLGLIGRPLTEAGFAPASIGFDPAGEDFRVRTLPVHNAVATSAVQYRQAAERVSDKTQQLERDEQARLRAEVELLWNNA
ncbi:MAG: hypothetical protein WCK41_04650 [Actinomycetes bacterium]